MLLIEANKGCGVLQDKKNLRLSLARESGAAFIEAAIILPILFFVVFGIIQYGLIISTQINLKDVSSIGARYATLYRENNLNTMSVEAAAKEGLHSWIDKSAVSVSVTNPYTHGAIQDATRVQVTYDLPLLIPYAVPGATGGVYTLNVETVMR